MGDEMRHLMDATDELDEILRDGAERAQKIAGPIMVKTKEILDFIR